MWDQNYIIWIQNLTYYFNFIFFFLNFVLTLSVKIFKNFDIFFYYGFCIIHFNLSFKKTIFTYTTISVCLPTSAEREFNDKKYLEIYLKYLAWKFKIIVEGCRLRKNITLGFNDVINAINEGINFIIQIPNFIKSVVFFSINSFFLFLDNIKDNIISTYNFGIKIFKNIKSFFYFTFYNKTIKGFFLPVKYGRKYFKKFTKMWLCCIKNTKFKKSIFYNKLQFVHNGGYVSNSYKDIFRNSKASLFYQKYDPMLRDKYNDFFKNIRKSWNYSGIDHSMMINNSTINNFLFYQQFTNSLYGSHYQLTPDFYIKKNRLISKYNYAHNRYIFQRRDYLLYIDNWYNWNYNTKNPLFTLNDFKFKYEFYFMKSSQHKDSILCYSKSNRKVKKNILRLLTYSRNKNFHTYHISILHKNFYKKSHLFKTINFNKQLFNLNMTWSWPQVILYAVYLCIFIEFLLFDLKTFEFLSENITLNGRSFFKTLFFTLPVLLGVAFFYNFYMSPVGRCLKLLVVNSVYNKSKLKKLTFFIDGYEKYHNHLVSTKRFQVFFPTTYCCFKFNKTNFYSNDFIKFNTFLKNFDSLEFSVLYNINRSLAFFSPNSLNFYIRSLKPTYYKKKYVYLFKDIGKEYQLRFFNKKTNVFTIFPTPNFGLYNSHFNRVFYKTYKKTPFAGLSSFNVWNLQFGGWCKNSVPQTFEINDAFLINILNSRPYTNIEDLYSTPLNFLKFYELKNNNEYFNNLTSIKKTNTYYYKALDKTWSLENYKIFSRINNSHNIIYVNRSKKQLDSYNPNTQGLNLPYTFILPKSMYQDDHNSYGYIPKNKPLDTYKDNTHYIASPKNFKLNSHTEYLFAYNTFNQNFPNSNLIKINKNNKTSLEWSNKILYSSRPINYSLNLLPEQFDTDFHQNTQNLNTLTKRYFSNFSYDSQRLHFNLDQHILDCTFTTFYKPISLKTLPSNYLFDTNK